MKMYMFFAHFNRINMQRGDPKVWTVHFRGQCIPCESVEFRVKTRTRYRPNGRQPRAVMIGKAAFVSISDGHAVVG